jgi:hypothetical protein
MVVLPSGWAICWVFFAGNISRVDEDAFRFRDVVDVSENIIGGSVAAPAFPPTFDHSSVVAEDLDVGVSWCRGGKGEYEEEEADCLCPSNVLAIGFPAR